jgi:DNA-binding response OmpR family regulator
MKECDTMRILVVEDDRLLNNTLCYNLDAAGYVVDSALTKSAASNFLTKQDYDLIVLDVNLPDGNGFDFCREVKERRPDTAVIFLTANDMESDMLKGYELGAEDYVTKPFPMSVFQKKLSVVLRSGRSPPYPAGAPLPHGRNQSHSHPAGLHPARSGHSPAWSESCWLLILSMQSPRHSPQHPGYSTKYYSKVGHPRLLKFALYHTPSFLV